RRRPGAMVQPSRATKSEARPAPGWRIVKARSSIGRCQLELLGEFALPAVAVGEQFFLVVEEFLAGFGREFEVGAFDDRIDRAGFLAIAAIDAFCHVDVVAGRA